MRQIALVIAARHHEATVQICGGDCCSNCPSNKAGGLLGIKRPELSVANPLDAKPGEQVVIEYDSASALRAGAVLFLVPILAILAGLFAGQALGRNHYPGHEESAALLGALAFLAFSLACIALYDRKLRKTHDPGKPTIVEIVESESADCSGGAKVVR